MASKMIVGSGSKISFEVRNDSALGEQILDVAQTQREAEIQPDRLPNDRGREAVAVVADLLHGVGEPNPRQVASRKRRDNALAESNMTAPAPQPIRPGVTPSP